MFQCVQPRSELPLNTNMRGPYSEIRTGMDSQQECLDIRLKQQEQEVADLMDILKRRAEIEKKYSRDMESLSKTMRHKHKEMLGGGGSTRPTTVTNVLRELIAETGELARLHTRLDETLTGEMAGICSNILSDAQLQHKQCKLAATDIQENVLRSLYELQNNSKVFTTNKALYEKALEKYMDAERDAEKEKEKFENKPEKLEKSKKYKEKIKVFKTRQENEQDALVQVKKSQLVHILSAEAANKSVSKHYKEEMQELMDCMDLTYHHHVKNLVTVYNSHREDMKTAMVRHMMELTKACENLDARRDKNQFFQDHLNLFTEPAPFKYEDIREYQSPLEKMNELKITTDENVQILRQQSESIRQQIEAEEKRLLHIINSVSLAKHLSKKEDKKTTLLQEIQETIIEKIKQLIIINNKIVQQEARYNYIKKTLILQNFCPETLPRPDMTKRKPRTQTNGPPRLFGGTLDEYYEATSEKIPPVIESCIKYINKFGMRHQGIFRIGGAHADITKFEEDFEKSGDPFSEMTNGNHLNSVAGVLKSYFRKLEEPLFSQAYFDQLMNITRHHGVTSRDKDSVEETPQFVVMMREVLQQWSEPCLVVTRYLFSFLNDLTRYSDQTQMDPFNLAICFGPTLCPIPSDKDLVQHTNLVNDLIMNFIIHCPEIFNFPINGPVYTNLDERFTTEKEEEHLQPSQDWWRGSKDGDQEVLLIPDSYIRVVSQDQENTSPATPRRKDSDAEEGVISKLPSFNTKKMMWEEKTLERKGGKAPDLLKDLLNKSQETEVVVPTNEKQETLVVD